ncbi:MAG TPA: hypothetical protein K8V56_00555 [Sporosarcina psychrophila]|uniref:Uncharacterized protein n=1 Tax=Sporosarcina psychrophila TaxID=1476 RepID=A0A921FV42_SPOPS|nr:hypothetical protein [Sporosarcina psychrophila]
MPKQASYFCMNNLSPIDFASSKETFGITPLPSPLINFFSMKSYTPKPDNRVSSRSKNVQRRSTTTTTPVSISQATKLDSFLQVSALPIVTFASEVNILFDSYEYLAQLQGTKFAIVHVHTPEERNKFKHLIFDQANNQFNDHGKRTSPDFLKLCKHWCSTSDGITIFYKTPEQLKAYYNKKLKSLKIVNARIDNRLTLRKMNVLVQNPERRAPVASTSTFQQLQDFPVIRTVQSILEEPSVASANRQQRELVPAPNRSSFLPVAHPVVLNSQPIPRILSIASQPTLNPVNINRIKRPRFCKDCSTMGCPGGQPRGTCPN